MKKLSFSGDHEDEHPLLEVTRRSEIARIDTLSIFDVEPSYAGITCSVRFRRNHLVRL